MRKILMLSFFLVLAIAMNAQEKGYYQVLLGYEGDRYSEPYERYFNVYSMGVGYKTNLTAIYGKFNIGFVNGETSNWNNMQAEVDYYQSLTKNKSTTMWLNYAYSPDDAFPTHRLMYEFWQKLPANFLVSAGGSHYFFDEPATILNLGLENYFSRYWLEFKTYFYLTDPKVTLTYTLTGRVFFKEINYFQLGFGIGSAQDAPFLLPDDLTTLDARTVKVGYVQSIFKQKMQIRAGFSYSYEEYLEDQWRNRYNFGLGLIFNIR